MAASDCYLANHAGLRHVYTGSTSPTHARWFSRGWRNEADLGSLSLRPARLLALHQQELLLLSFHRQGHPLPMSAITTWATQSIPRTGLSPARNTAVWAANRPRLQQTINRSIHQVWKASRLPTTEAPDRRTDPRSRDWRIRKSRVHRRVRASRGQPHPLSADSDSSPRSAR